MLPALGGLALALVTVPAHAHDPITWYTFDGGGVSFATAGDLRLGGTIGQPDAGTLAGGGYTLRGGFWLGGQAPQSGIPARPGPNAVFRVLPTVPNPVRALARVTFDLPVASNVTLAIFDVAGRTVQRTELGQLPAGRHEKAWNAVGEGGRPLATGMYFLRLDTGQDRAVQKVLVIR